ncbi:MAG TPA: MDR family MFS transporter [Alphaproteobacteria bacterium]|nr:MDR family MFS transporter [Alphaproteobacteria bacterium]
MSEIQSSPSRTRRPLVLAATMLAMFMAAVEATIVATAMPTIIAELGGFQLFSWVFAIYLLTQAVSIPIYGKLADIFGRKPAFYAGAILFLAGSALAGLSSGMIWLILFRAVQGLGAGAIMPIASTIVADIYTPSERGKVQGYLSSVWGVAAVIGPALGAFFVEHVGWPYVFWLNLPIGVVAIVLLACFLHEDVKHRIHHVDYLGACLLMFGTAALMLALIQGASLPLAGVLALLFGSALCLAFFFYVERRTVEPIIPFELWRHRVIATGNIGQVASGAVMIGTAIFVPTYVQGVLGASAASAGISVGAMSLAWPIASYFAGRVMLNLSFRLAAVAGALLLIAGSVVLSMLTPERGLVFASAGAFLIGLGMGFSNLTYLVAVQTSVEWRRRGIATSLNLFMRMVGQSVGTACFGALMNFGVASFAVADPEIVNRMMNPDVRRTIEPDTLEHVTRALASSLHDVFLIALLFALAGLVIAMRIPGDLNAKNAVQASKPA